MPLFVDSFVFMSLHQFVKAFVDTRNKKREGTIITKKDKLFFQARQGKGQKIKQLPKWK